MKNTKLIEFDYEKYKAGAKAVYRNGDVPQMVILPEIPNKEYPLISIDKGGFTNSHTNNGIYNKSKEENNLDLLLEVEEESEPELFMNGYEDGSFSSIYNTIEATVKAGQGVKFTTYKLVKVNQ